MIITNNNDKMNMTYKQFTKQPMQAVESRLHVNIAKNPHLLTSSSRYINHHLIKNFSR